jgi:hypothetical protein
MAQKLLFHKYLLKIHIALIICIALCSAKLMAQSVLLPGDIVIVSANSDSQSIDFIPLIDIEEGTEIYFSAGVWDDTTQTLHGEELSVEFLKSIDAGSSIHVNEVESELFKVTGSLGTQGDTRRLFAFQKMETYYRHIFALGWGKGKIWNVTSSDSASSDVPRALKEDELFLTLGTAKNYQYYIRNGASGTRDLLQKFVTDEANWRSSESSFPYFGTSFNLLSPPVILFERSLSTVSEQDSVAVLNVAIYEHDGSRLTVDVVFDSLQSIIDKEDINGYRSTKLNFTGLIGNALYEVHVPIIDDKNYEGRETGIFRLENLTKGNFGDFLAHSLVINDDEKPDVTISVVANNQVQPDVIEIRNEEDGVVSLTGWELVSNNMSFGFPRQLVLYPGETLKIVDQNKNEGSDSSDNVIYTNSESLLLSEEGGNLKLVDYKGEVINEKAYEKPLITENEKPTTSRESVASSSRNQAVKEISVMGQQGSAFVTLSKNMNPGWKVMNANDDILQAFPETEWIIWNEETSSFESFEESDHTTSSKSVIFGHFDANKAEKLSTWVQNENSAEKAISENNKRMHWKVSATDKNENGQIDQLEGLNLLLNDLNSSLSVKKVMHTLQTEYPEIEFSPTLYSINQKVAGELDFEPLTKKDSIPSKAPFWIMLKEKLVPTELVLDQDQLLESADLVEPATGQAQDEQQSITFALTIPETEIEETVKLNFEDDIENINSLKDLESYPELQPGDHSFFQSSFNLLGEYYKELDLSSEVTSNIEIPLYFETDKSNRIQLSVRAWENIPADWEIMIEDRQLDKKYMLRDGFVLNFEHQTRARNEGQIQEGEEDVQNDQFERKEDHRFTIHVIAERAEVQDTETTDKPRELELYQNYPNPFNPITTISFYIPEPREVKLSVFNIVGQPISVIVDGMLSAGEKHYEWDARDRPSGMYIYQLEVGNKVMTRKMTLVK